MDRARWRHIEEVYQSASELPVGERDAYLRDACRGDEDLRREVESLLAQASHGTPLDRPAWELAAGARLGPYELLEPIGQGGMGTVFKASDTRLNRSVAIKVSSAQFSGRFAIEARAVAALNHPHVCTLYDVGPNYLVMEFVEGENLAQRLEKDALPLDQALRYAVEIADAVVAAHARGIVHRDLKPGNIMLTKSGVKVLDFGLAKFERPVAGEDRTHSATAAGTLLGTVQYMSPEQAQGKPADARSDIFSFGLVLYEMITGKRAFAGTNPASIVAAILEREAPSLEPEGLNRVVRACLAKDPADRFQTARDLRRALEWSVSGDGALIQALPQPGGVRHWAGWSIAAVLAMGLAALALTHFREKPPDPATPMRFRVQTPTEGRLLLNVSPDGRKVAFVAQGKLWVHLLESGVSRDLSVPAGGVPFWSPDSRFIGYPFEGKISRIEAAGGPPQTVASYSGAWGGGAWNRNDVIVFGGRQAGLFRVPASGGAPVQITALDAARHESFQFCASFLPDDSHFVYARASTDEEKSAIYLGSVDAAPEQQSLKPLVSSNSQPAYVSTADPSTGYLLFVREGTLMAQLFDHRRLELKGKAMPIAGQVSDSIPGVRYVAFSASNDVLAFPPRSAGHFRSVWYDREGKVMGTAGEEYYGLSAIGLSPDGAKLAVTRLNGGSDTSNIWLSDLSRGGASTRLTFGSRVDEHPVWSPDGSRIVFSSNRAGVYNLYEKSVNGGNEERMLFESGENKTATSWSRNGRFLLYTEVHPKTKADIWVLPMDGGKKPFPFLTTDFNERQARFSPDGRWVAYTSDESGQDEVYVRPFSINAAGTAVEAGARWPISGGFGTEPHWRGDGRELFYRSRDKLLAVEIAVQPAFRAGIPQPLAVPVLLDSWDAAADGKRFLGLTRQGGPQPYTVMLNWQAGLRR